MAGLGRGTLGQSKTSEPLPGEVKGSGLAQGLPKGAAAVGELGWCVVGLERAGLKSVKELAAAAAERLRAEGLGLNAHLRVLTRSLPPLSDEKAVREKIKDTIEDAVRQWAPDVVLLSVPDHVAPEARLRLVRDLQTAFPALPLQSLSYGLDKLAQHSGGPHDPSVICKGLYKDLANDLAKQLAGRPAAKGPLFVRTENAPSGGGGDLANGVASLSLKEGPSSAAAKGAEGEKGAGESGAESGKEVTHWAIIDGMEEELRLSLEELKNFFDWVLPKLDCAHFHHRPTFRTTVAPGAEEDFVAAVERAKAEAVGHVFVLLPNDLDTGFFDLKKRLEFQLAMSLQAVRQETVKTRFHGGSCTRSFDHSALRNMIRRDRLALGLPELEAPPALDREPGRFKKGFTFKVLDKGALSLRTVARVLAEKFGLVPVRLGRLFKGYPAITGIFVQLDAPLMPGGRLVVDMADPLKEPALPPLIGLLHKALQPHAPHTDLVFKLV